MAKKTSQSENLIHVKLEYPEAVQSKKDILSTQKDLIEVLKSIKRYHLIRKEELKLKEIILKKIRELKTSMTKLNQTFPSIKLPKIITHESEYDEKKETIKKIKEISGKDLKQNDLERELADIQKKLKALE
jgi:vacuolar-type H+-ATPase subunit I/STV1